MSPGPLRVFDGDRLRAELLNPGQGRLFVSFRQRVGQPGAFDAARPVMGFVSRGYSHLHIQSRQNDWFVNPETGALEMALVRLAGDFDERVSMGFSMGGYGVLRFAQALRLDRAVLISPQYTIWKKLVPWDKRYRAESKGWDHALGDLEPRRVPLGGVILADPFRPADLGHAQMIRTVFPGLALVRLACGGHPATRVLNQGGRFGWLKDMLAEGAPDPAAIGRAHRAVRRRSESYWRHLAAVAERRGRPALAAEASRRAGLVARDGAAAATGAGLADGMVDGA